jgi:hypothetical protein
MSARKGQPSGKCAVCGHVDQVKIEILLAGGAGQTAVGKKFALSKDSIHRHWHGHVSMERRAMLIMGPVPRQALAAQVCEENTSVLDNLRIVRAGLWNQYDAALAAGDRFGVAILAGKLHNNLQITAKITGELASSPLININNTQNNNVAMLESPAVTQLLARIIGVLRPFEDARLAMLAEFSKFEATPAVLPAIGETFENEAAA